VSDYVIGAPPTTAPSPTNYDGHHMTPTLPTARLSTPPYQRHYLDRV